MRKTAPHARILVAAAVALLPSVIGCSGGTTGGLDLSRYPRRVPEWLWQDPRHGRRVSPALRAELERDLKQVGSMRVFGETSPVLRREREVARKLAAAFAVADLAEGAPVVTGPAHGLALAVQVDPTFDGQARRTLLEASRLFVRHALDDGVIDQALSDSTRQGQGEHGPPRDASSFKAHLRQALAPSGGEPALLVISLYRGNAWWGGAKLNFFHDRTYHLSRVPPPRGYLYIRLNADKLRPAEPHGQDPAFWAGKIAHEALHNLGYTHPRYRDPADRDARNQPGRMAFVVAYETAVREKANGAANRHE